MALASSQMSNHRHHHHQIQLQTSQKTCHQLLKSLKVTDDHQIPQGKRKPGIRGTGLGRLVFKNSGIGRGQVILGRPTEP